MFILPSIAGIMPDSPTVIKDWNIPRNIELADPQFFIQQNVDILIGAEVFFNIMSVGQIKLGPYMPLLQKTLFGWIVSGKYASNSKSINCNSLVATLENNDVNTDANLHELVKNFWQIESVETNSNKLTEEELSCERFFKSTVQRSSSGKIIVKLPFKRHFSELGSSRQIAEKRFLSLERRLNSNSNLKEEYSKFLEEYLRLDHMELVSKHDERLLYYLPHHCVLKPHSSTTKLRFVFDGSYATTSGLSLNDILMIGIPAQEDLYSILLRFRFYKYGLKADICKMYKQFLLDESNAYYQCILWRNNSSEEIQTFKLKTVTYCTFAASYLATKSLVHLATLNAEMYPKGAQKILKDMYVDDLISGADSFEEMSNIKGEVETILASANIVSTSPTKYKTKKMVLKQQAFPRQLFDPIGLINPVVVRSKIFLQRLWLLKLDWDESIPTELHTEWENFRRGLHLLDQLSIPRFVKYNKSAQVELHGFCDASSKVYGCCIYLRCIDPDGTMHVNLLTAKSKIAPIKTQSIPRLELLNQILGVEINEIFLWSDSEIALSWISAHPSTWTVFFANRVSQIQQLIENYKWLHVNAKANAADILSRGSNVSELINSTWFIGPDFLRKTNDYWPMQKVKSVQSITLEKRATLTSQKCDTTHSQVKSVIIILLLCYTTVQYDFKNLR
ncbi:uncharacterized protein LOC129616521 [Condylostylus longicornis]|uniref:uncharacterized protein LOC129616521 n=1 Tax=Condylostylus longicornis TaxID=2530218 RepID=UPI00244DA281|nr:uncharacterized protein LOC129616521 [Condylostylus longicornis]